MKNPFILFLLVIVINFCPGFAQDSATIAYVNYNKIRSEHPGIQQMHQQFLTEVAQIKQEYSVAEINNDSSAAAIDKNGWNRASIDADTKDNLRQKRMQAFRKSRLKYISEVKLYENNLQYVLRQLCKTHGFKQVKDISEYDASSGQDITEMVLNSLATLSSNKERSE